jgi:hypothetical protein
VLVNRGTEWGVPAADITELNGFITVADAAMQLAESSDRSPVITAQCREAFKNMVGKMRYIKTHYFHTPPLTESDFAALLLDKPGYSPSEIPDPTAQPTADLTFPGVHMVELIRIRPIGDAAPNPRTNYGVRIYWGLTGEPTEMNRFRLTELPKTGRDLPSSLFTRRKKERFDFEGESGNRVYFCLRYETASGKEGPFGPILTAVIP